MAYCPECKGEMSSTEIKCSKCGYDFPDTSTRPSMKQQGFAYSPLADLALIVSMIATVCGTIVAAIVAIAAVASGQWFNGLVSGPIAVLIQMGILVVFLRVQQ